MLHFHCSVKEPKLGLVYFKYYLTSLLTSSFLCSSDSIWPREEAGVVGIISPTSLIFQNLGSEGRGWRQVRLEWWRLIHCRYRRHQHLSLPRLSPNGPLLRHDEILGARGGECTPWTMQGWRCLVTIDISQHPPSHFPTDCLTVVTYLRWVATPPPLSLLSQHRWSLVHVDTHYNALSLLWGNNRLCTNKSCFAQSFNWWILKHNKPHVHLILFEDAQCNARFIRENIASFFSNIFWPLERFQDMILRRTTFFGFRFETRCWVEYPLWSA